jgi:hypothetical protein
MADNTRRDMLLRTAALAASFGLLDSTATEGQLPAGQAPANNAHKTRPKGAEKGVASANNIQQDPRIDSVSKAANKLLNELKSPAALSRLSFAPQSLYQRDADSWNLVRERANKYYKTQHDDHASISQQVESGYLHVQLPSDVLFRMQHVEVLLDQAADLLERALAQRAEWSDLGTKAFNVSSELQQFFKIDEIHQDETAHGFYTHDAAQASADVVTQSQSQEVLSEQALFLLSLVDQYYSTDVINQQSGFSQLLAWLGHLANYYREANDTFMQYGWNGVEKTSHDHAKDAATGTSFQNLFLQAALLQAQGTSTYSASQSAANQAYALKIKSDWEQANISFRMRRTEVARRLADKKAREYTLPDGVLNYPERMEYLKARFDRDFRDALARMTAIVTGMQVIYGYQDKLPVSVSDVLHGKRIEHSGAFDECLVWVRNAISYVIRFSHAEQRYVIPISVRQLIGDGQYGSGLKSHPFASWNFKITPDLFPEQYNVRVKGVSLFVVPREALLPAFQGQYLRGVWTGSLKAPRNSYFQHFPSGRGSETVPVDQSALPQVFSGRISCRDSYREPDVIGGTSLLNASPFGEWTVRVSRTSTEGVSISDIHDIVLDLTVVVRA